MNSPTDVVQNLLRLDILRTCGRRRRRQLRPDASAKGRPSSRIAARPRGAVPMLARRVGASQSRVGRKHHQRRRRHFRQRRLDRSVTRKSREEFEVERGQAILQRGLEPSRPDGRDRFSDSVQLVWIGGGRERTGNDSLRHCVVVYHS